MKKNNFRVGDPKRLALITAPLLCGISISDVYAVEDNRDFVSNTILSICPSGVLLGTELQDRCNELVGEDDGIIPNNILTQVTSEQTAAQKSISLEMNSTQLGLLSNRISAIRSGRQGGGLNISGLMMDSNGNPVSSNQFANWGDYQNKGAAGDDSYERLGVFVNGNIGFGDRRTTVNEAGYNLDTHGGTVGMDYRFTDNFLMGMAFGYNNATSRYRNNLGDMEADNYTGAVYASFYTEDGFFIDGIFSGSHIDYSTRRRIQYNFGNNINTNAIGDNSGREFNVSMNTGYNFNVSGLTITPQVRVDYTSSQVDALNERGGLGWALHIDEQDFDSMQTAAGLQLNYAVSLPWAVIVPMARAEYIHEFKNDQRNIQAFFIQDPTQTRFNIQTDKPDRDYIVMSAGISAQFMHGISAFVNYDTVQAHSFVNNHNFSGGVRVQVPF
ncbi:MAG: autotransporter outer membrane beta-barrel domain-containing protein [Gammaproteobacteria bacterium]|jgi:outer membrane autotransporter protein|uniref:autotransporter outer membrane beta-barrel domain-containing protein n=1 Tax=Methylotuvimicrobium sp. TaxID=2822413 RepID=UPI001D41039C|nr:autotransporter outer membrane beta-barrel domain-containing protein [Gammaproteobacteria bacterium]